MGRERKNAAFFLVTSSSRSFVRSPSFIWTKLIKYLCRINSSCTLYTIVSVYRTALIRTHVGMCAFVNRRSQSRSNPTCMRMCVRVCVYRHFGNRATATETQWPHICRSMSMENDDERMMEECGRRRNDGERQRKKPTRQKNVIKAEKIGSGYARFGWVVWVRWCFILSELLNLSCSGNFRWLWRATDGKWTCFIAIYWRTVRFLGYFMGIFPDFSAEFTEKD